LGKIPNVPPQNRSNCVHQGGIVALKGPFGALTSFPGSPSKGSNLPWEGNGIKAFLTLEVMKTLRTGFRTRRLKGSQFPGRNKTIKSNKGRRPYKRE